MITEKGYIDKKYLEQTLLFMRKHENFITYDWRHKEFYTCFFAKEENGTTYMGSIGIFHGFGSTPSYNFYSENEDMEIHYKSFKKTPDWFQRLCQKTKKEHLMMSRSLLEKTKESGEEDYLFSDEYENEEISLDNEFDYEDVITIKEAMKNA